MPLNFSVIVDFLMFVHQKFQERRYPNGEASLTSPLTGKQFVLVGAGGAGRALAFGARSRGARLVIFDIDFGIETTHFF